MLYIKQILIITLILAAAINIKAQQNDLQKVTGPYMGQKPPGATPEILLNQSEPLFCSYLFLTLAHGNPAFPS
jgi:hypothetical protein